MQPPLRLFRRLILSPPPRVHTAAAHLTAPANAPSSSDPDFFNIVTPLVAAEWRCFLKKAGLDRRYPSLVEKIETGFPIAFDLPKITYSIIPTNHKSARDHIQEISRYLDEETELGGMSGPWSLEEVEEHMGPVLGSPMGLVPKGFDKWRVTRDLSFITPEVGWSVNSVVDADEWPTRWTSASKVEAYVSRIFLSYRAARGACGCVASFVFGIGASRNPFVRFSGVTCCVPALVVNQRR